MRCAGRGRRLGGNGVGTHGEDGRSLRHLRVHHGGTTEDALRRDTRSIDVDGIGDHAAAGAYREPTGDLLAVGGRRHEHGSGGEGLHQTGENIDDRDHRMVDESRTLGDVDVGGAVLPQGIQGLTTAIADPHRRGLAEATRQRE